MRMRSFDEPPSSTPLHDNEWQDADSGMCGAWTYVVAIWSFSQSSLLFTAGNYNGSTFALLGRNCPLDAVRELPAGGGTGAFRFARGYALLLTHWLDFGTGDATVEYDVNVMSCHALASRP
ncbi:dirigent protein 20-like [Miscanthus floridulus]|uniref:dirigent protein 20-like n=1 Tax=Miscanthus floridulus TaxID=154761 RepID=UPI0034580CB3